MELLRDLQFLMLGNKVYRRPAAIKRRPAGGNRTEAVVDRPQ